MTLAPDRDPGGPQPLDRLATLFIALLSVAVTTRFALQHDLGFDEVWHVFASTVQPFAQILDELKMEAHPPLHYLAVRLSTLHSESLLWPRVASILPGAVSAVLVYYCALELRVARSVALLGSVAFALAPSQINMAACVRAYSLATAFTMLACLQLLRSMRAPMPASRRHGVAFALAGVLAMATEYSAVLVVAAGVALLLAVELAATPARAWVAIANRRWPELTIAGVGFVALVAYRRWADFPAYFHLTQFFPQPGEHLLHFVATGLPRALTDLLSPLTVPPGPSTWIALGAFMAITIGMLLRYADPRSQYHDVARSSVLVIHLLLWLALVGLAYAGLYPFGGRLRQQFVVFPFLLLSVLLVVDEIYRTLPGRRARAVLCAMVAALIVAGFQRGIGKPLEEFAGGPFWQPEVAAARRLLRAQDAIYTRQFNQVGLYSNLRSWQWVHSRRLAPGQDIFTVERGAEHFTVIRDRLWVVPSPPTPQLLAQMKGIVDTNHLGGLVVLAIPQEQFDRAGAESAESERFLAELSRQNGLVLTDCVILDAGVVFRVAGNAGGFRSEASERPPSAGIE